MKVGALVRANGRGLHWQTLETARALDARVLVVDVPNASAERFPTDPTAYPGAPVVTVQPGWRLPEHQVRAWLDGLDAVWTAETFYDARFAGWARDAGAVTAIHLNPEFFEPGGGWGIGTEVDAWWSATSWRREFLPAGLEVVPQPVAVDRFAPVEPHGSPCRFLHVAGKRALHDRNGTEALLAALPLLRRPCTVTIACQDAAPVNVPRLPDHVRVTLRGASALYWALYDGHDALVLPRRYGGLCLPVGEAMAAGMAVLMPDVTPNREAWPVSTFPALGRKLERMPGGQVPVHRFEPAQIAAAMDQLADPLIRHGWQELSRNWAGEHSWTVQAPLWRGRFAALRANAAA